MNVADLNPADLRRARNEAAGIAIVLRRRGELLAATVFDSVRAMTEAEELRRMYRRGEHRAPRLDRLEDAEPLTASRARRTAAAMAHARAADPEEPEPLRLFWIGVAASIADVASERLGSDVVIAGLQP